MNNVNKEIVQYDGISYGVLRCPRCILGTCGINRYFNAEYYVCINCGYEEEIMERKDAKSKSKPKIYN